MGSHVLEKRQMSGGAPAAASHARLLLQSLLLARPRRDRSAPDGAGRRSRLVSTAWDVTVVAGIRSTARRGCRRPSGATASASFARRHRRLTRRRFIGRATNYLTYFTSAVVKGLAIAQAGRRRRADRSADHRSRRARGAASARAPLGLSLRGYLSGSRDAAGGLSQCAVNDALARSIVSLCGKPTRIVALGDTMKRRLVEGKGADPAKMAVIHNWADCRAYRSGPRDNPFARQHGLVDRFVVLHAGNIGLSQDLEVVSARRRTAAGSKRHRVRLRGRRREEEGSSRRLRRVAISRNVMFLPFQPRERWMDSRMRRPTSSLISLKRGLAGVHRAQQAVQRARVRPSVHRGRGARLRGRRHHRARIGCGFVVAPATRRAAGARSSTLAANRDRRGDMGARARVLRRSNSTARDRLRPTTRCSREVARGVEARLRRRAVGRGLLIPRRSWLLIAAAIKIEDGGPVLFAQDRVGLAASRFAR